MIFWFLFNLVENFNELLNRAVFPPSVSSIAPNQEIVLSLTALNGIWPDASQALVKYDDVKLKNVFLLILVLYFAKALILWKFWGASKKPLFNVPSTAI